MARFSFIVIVMAICVAISAATAYGGGGGEEQIGWFPARRTCEGSIGECLAEEDEYGMSSEISRRILATTKYISYGALQRNTVPCSRRGQSYYNCQPGARANPYDRGCSAIAQCRS